MERSEAILILKILTILPENYEYRGDGSVIKSSLYNNEHFKSLELTSDLYLNTIPKISNHNLINNYTCIPMRENKVFEMFEILIPNEFYNFIMMDEIKNV